MTYLEVPFREKDQAKALGARWDNLQRKWFVPSDLEDQLDRFERWLPKSGDPLQDDAPSADLFATASTPAQAEQKGMPLSKMLQNVQFALRQAFPGAQWVIAEIANLNRRRGHVYLELTETNDQGQTLASCRAMIWQSQAERLLTRFETETGSPFQPGQKVLLLAEVNLHERFGFSLVIQDIDPSYTLGELEANLSAIRKQLISEKLYALNKQQTLPDDFFRIAVIAPPEAAGLGDFRADADLLQSHGLCEFKYFYSAFQGEQVEPEMRSALEAVESLHQANPFDALVIIRGGGAKLDLNHLNQYVIARKICEARLPVLTGIGHERDNTILDEVAHSRYDTPSKVIADIRQHIFHKAQAAKQHWQQIEQASQTRVQQYRHHLQQLEQTVLNQSRSSLHAWKEKLAPLKYQLQKQGQHRVQVTHQQMERLYHQVQSGTTAQLEQSKRLLEQEHHVVRTEAKRAVNYQHSQIIQWIAFILSSGPKTQLNRGFALARDKQGTPLKTAHDAKAAGCLDLQFSDGTVEAKIESDAEIKPNKV